MRRKPSSGGGKRHDGRFKTDVSQDDTPARQGRAEGLVTVSKNEITLTEAGAAEADGLMERSAAVKALLLRIGAPEPVAGENAALLAGVMTDELYEIVKNLRI